MNTIKETATAFVIADNFDDFDEVVDIYVSSYYDDWIYGEPFAGGKYEKRKDIDIFFKTGEVKQFVVDDKGLIIRSTHIKISGDYYCEDECMLLVDTKLDNLVGKELTNLLLSNNLTTPTNISGQINGLNISNCFYLRTNE